MFVYGRMTWRASFGVLVLCATGLGGCIVEDQTQLPLAQSYVECVEDFDCSSTFDRCETIAVEADGQSTSARMCTRPCTDDNDCPRGGYCSAVSGTPLCYAGCIDDYDCSYPFICGDTENDGPLCLPAP